MLHAQGVIPAATPQPLHKNRTPLHTKINSHPANPPPPHRRPHKIPSPKPTSPSPPRGPHDLRDPEGGVECCEEEQPEGGSEEEADGEGYEEEG